jgi:hypothetical protein
MDARIDAYIGQSPPYRSRADVANAYECPGNEGFRDACHGQPGSISALSWLAKDKVGMYDKPWGNFVANIPRQRQRQARGS